MVTRNLGKTVSVHGVAPATLQRVAVVAMLSFVFFLAMLVAFYIRQHLGYFLLSTGFLVVYILTMIGWIAMRRHELRIHENGIACRKFEASWSEIGEARLVPGKGLLVVRADGASTTVAESVDGFGKIAGTVSTRIGK